MQFLALHKHGEADPFRCAADEIAKYRSELTDLLWEFDDYLEPDCFDTDKFAELQTASRKAAPKIYDILMRMKLDISFRDDLSSRGSIAQLPTPTSPPTIPALFSTGSHSLLGSGGSVTDFRHVDEATAQMRKLLQQANFDDGPPRPPSANPWDWQTKQSVDGRGQDESESVHHRAGDESPVLPSGTPGSEPRRQSLVTPQPTPSVTSAPSEHGGSQHDGEDRRLSSVSTSSHNTFGHGYQRQKNVMSSYSIPENSVTEQQNGMIPYFQTTNTFSPVSPHGRQTSMTPSMKSEAGDAENVLPSPGDPRPPSGFNPVPSLGRPSPLPPAILEAQPGLEVVEMPKNNESELGPIPVESERQASETQSTSPTPSHSLVPQTPLSTHGSIASIDIPIIQSAIGESSSYRIAKGFCDGAAEVIRGGIGVKRTKKPVVSIMPTPYCQLRYTNFDR